MKMAIWPTKGRRQKLLILALALFLLLTGETLINWGAGIYFHYYPPDIGFRKEDNPLSGLAEAFLGLVQKGVEAQERINQREAEGRKEGKKK